MTGEHPGGDARVCPSWCVIQHHDQGHPDDLVHEGAHREVAAVSLVRYRYDSDDEEWIYVGDGRSGLDLSPESAQRLARAITGLLGGVQAQPGSA